MFSHCGILQALMQHAESQPDKNAIVVGSNEVTYAQLKANVQLAAGLLASMGMKAGDRIMLSAHKDIEFVYLYLGAHILGVTNVIVDAESKEERLRYIEEKTQPVCCFGYVSPNHNSILFSELHLDEAIPYVNEVEGLKADDVAEILFTTGTTGAPKGVILSYANIYGSANNINQFIQNTQDDVEILGLPICHSFGLGRIRCNIIKGATIVILGNFANVRHFFKAIEQYGVTGFGVVPAAWAYIRKISGKRIEKYAPQIHYIEIGSAAMPLDTKKEMLEMFPNTRICMHYGLTEASRSCFVEFHDVEHIDSIGKPVCEKVDVRIFDANGNPVTNGYKGELCVKGNMVLLRYLEDQDTKKAFFGEYFRTGDCGYMTDEGYIYLLGREKELINVGGKKVSPMEVEDAIVALGVGDCVCVPMKDPDGIMGELVKCYVLEGSTELTFDQIADMLKDKLEHFKQPVCYEWIDKIPQTSTGKKQRVNLK